jgi:hypothetical protein
MACPMGGAAVHPATSATGFKDDVDGGPPGGHYRLVRQHPPPRLKTTSMVAPWGALPVGLIASATKFEDDVDGGPLGGAVGGSDGVDHRG